MKNWKQVVNRNEDTGKTARRFAEHREGLFTSLPWIDFALCWLFLLQHCQSSTAPSTGSRTWRVHERRSDLTLLRTRSNSKSGRPQKVERKWKHFPDLTRHKVSNYILMAITQRPLLGWWAMWWAFPHSWVFLGFSCKLQDSEELLSITLQRPQSLAEDCSVWTETQVNHSGLQLQKRSSGHFAFFKVLSILSICLFPTDLLSGKLESPRGQKDGATCPVSIVLAEEKDASKQSFISLSTPGRGEHKARRCGSNRTTGTSNLTFVTFVDCGTRETPKAL